MKRHLSYRQPIQLNIPIIPSPKYNNLGVNSTFQLRSWSGLKILTNSLRHLRRQEALLLHLGSGEDWDTSELVCSGWQGESEWGKAVRTVLNPCCLFFLTLLWSFTACPWFKKKTLSHMSDCSKGSCEAWGAPCWPADQSCVWPWLNSMYSIYNSAQRVQTEHKALWPQRVLLLLKEVEDKVKLLELQSCF